jgi:hypothetical protein
MQIDEHLYAEADAMVSEAAMTCAVSNKNWFYFLYHLEKNQAGG